MTLKLKDDIDLSEAKYIMLGGVEYSIPPLVLRQTVKIGPMLPAVLRIVNKRSQIIVGLDQEAIKTPEGQIDAVSRLALSDHELDVALNVISLGLSRAYHGCAVNDLYDLPISFSEIVDAMRVVAEQTHATKKADAAGKAEATSLSTGPDSSLDCA